MTLSAHIAVPEEAEVNITRFLAVTTSATTCSVVTMTDPSHQSKASETSKLIYKNHLPFSVMSF